MAPGRRSATVAAGLALAAVVVLCLGMSGCGGESGERSRSAETEAAELDSVAAAAHSVAGETALPLLLDLGSTTCVPCKAMAPILDEMRETFAGQFDVRFTDVKKDAAVAREYGIRIIPTQIFLDEHGNELFRHQGFYSREDMLAKWVELGYVFEE
jgi:thioredoxin 1